MGSCTAREGYMDSTLKHLRHLINAGIVVRFSNPRNQRRPFYVLAPGVKTSFDGELTILDFGFCVVRLSTDGN